MTNQPLPPRISFLEPTSKIAVDDIKWFRRNPERLFRARPTRRAELRHLQSIGYQPPTGMQIVTAVRKLSNGAILLYEVGPIEWGSCDPAEFDDAQAEALFEYLMGRVGGSA